MDIVEPPANQAPPPPPARRQATPVAGPVSGAAPVQPPGEPARPPLFTPEELEAFKARVSPLIGFNLDAYKPRQIERRITALLCRSSTPTLDDYLNQLEDNPQKLRGFVDGLMINVTEFFRNPDKFDELRTQVLPTLLAAHPTITIWSAGCSMGAEIYSVGILLEELGALDRAELIGTDLDLGVLEKARAGLYSTHEVQGLAPAMLERYFEPEGQFFRFKGEAIRARTRFHHHNLLLDPPLSGCHLVLCRNVVIYLNDASKRHLYRAFNQALVPGGVLFVGSTERIFDHRELGYGLLAPFFYQKTLPEE